MHVHTYSHRYIVHTYIRMYNTYTYIHTHTSERCTCTRCRASSTRSTTPPSFAAPTDTCKHTHTHSHTHTHTHTHLRALHLHSLYGKYHSHHHASFVPEAITGTCLVCRLCTPLDGAPDVHSQLTCFTGTKVQRLTKLAAQARYTPSWST
jgi:hypothetical protein